MKYVSNHHFHLRAALDDLFPATPRLIACPPTVYKKRKQYTPMGLTALLEDRFLCNDWNPSAHIKGTLHLPDRTDLNFC